MHRWRADGIYNTSNIKPSYTITKTNRFESHLCVFRASRMCYNSMNNFMRSYTRDGPVFYSTAVLRNCQNSSRPIWPHRFKRNGCIARVGLTSWCACDRLRWPNKQPVCIPHEERHGESSNKRIVIPDALVEQCRCKHEDRENTPRLIGFSYTRDRVHKKRCVPTGCILRLMCLFAHMIMRDGMCIQNRHGGQCDDQCTNTNDRRFRLHR